MTDYEAKARELLADALDAIGIRTTAVVSAAIESALASALRAAADERQREIVAGIREVQEAERRLDAVVKAWKANASSVPNEDVSVLREHFGADFLTAAYWLDDLDTWRGN